MENELVGKSWDKKRIVIAAVALFFLVGTAYAAKTYIFDTNEEKSSKKVSTKPSGYVAGVSTEENSKESSSDENKDQTPPFSFSPATIRADAQQKLDALREQVTNLKVEDVASASPQIQKVINDLKAFEQYPKNQAKQMCENICKSL